MRPQKRDELTAIALVLPSFFLILIFVYGFIAWTGYISLTDWRSMIPSYNLVGLRNYADLFALPRFQADIRNTVVFSLLFLPGCTILGLALAMLIDTGIKRGGAFFQNIYLFPLSLSFVVTGTVWAWIFNPTAGLNVLLERIGLGFLRSGWITDPKIALFSVAMAAVWQMSGFAMASYLAGLRGIDNELREAAKVDGASEWDTFRHIILPMLRPVTMSVLVMLGHSSLKIFDLIFVMTNGGPANATDVPGVYMFVATFRQDLFARGACIAMVMLGMVALVIVPYLVRQMRREVSV